MKGKELDIIIKGLVAEGKLWEAIKLGIKYIPNNNLVVQLAWRYKDVERHYHAGVLYIREYFVERNKISLALLSFLTELKPSIAYKKNRGWRVNIIWIMILTPFLDFSKLAKVYALLASLLLSITLSALNFNQIPKSQDASFGQSGILISFGSPNKSGSGEEVARPQPKPKKKLPKPAPVEEAPKEEFREKGVEEEIPTEYVLKKAAAAIKLKTEQEEKRKAEAARKKKETADAERRRKEKEAANLKVQIDGAFGESADSKGNTGTSGNQGDPSGDPNSDILDGVSTGVGGVGGGLGDRGGKGPAIKENSQAMGRVIIKVCVDANGKVVSAKFTLKNSTTRSQQLIEAAEANAMKWTFRKGQLDKQCGTITYDFKVK